MNKREMTPWFHSTTTPGRVGVYEVNTGASINFYAKWDGEKWCLTSRFPEEASKQKERSWGMYNGVKPQWRGFTHKQKGYAK